MNQIRGSFCPLIHVAYYRYSTLKQDLKLTPAGSLFSNRLPMIDKSRFINNPAEECIDMARRLAAMELTEIIEREKSRQQ